MLVVPVYCDAEKDTVSQASSSFNFSFTATAHFVSLNSEPRPPLLHPAAALHLKLHALRALRHVLRACPGLGHGLGHHPALLAALVDSSLAPCSSGSSSPLALSVSRTGSSNSSGGSGSGSGSGGKPLVLESAHPYQNNANEYHPVKGN